jgi:hypothetical protein
MCLSHIFAQSNSKSVYVYCSHLQQLLATALKLLWLRMSSGHICVISNTHYTVSHGGLEVDVPQKLLKMIDNKPVLKMVATHYKLYQLITGTPEASHCSLMKNDCIKQLEKLRNEASGLLQPPNIGAANIFLDEDEDATDPDNIPCRQPPGRGGRAL